MNIQDWFPLGLTSLISLLSQGLLRVFSSTTIWKHQFFSAQPSLASWWLSGKESTCSARDPSLIPGSGRSPREGNGNALQYSCLENPIDKGAWWATVHGITKSWRQLAAKHTHIIDIVDTLGVCSGNLRTINHLSSTDIRGSVLIPCISDEMWV